MTLNATCGALPFVKGSATTCYAATPRCIIQEGDNMKREELVSLLNDLHAVLRSDDWQKVDARKAAEICRLAANTINDMVYLPARASNPSTSRQAAKSVQVRSGTQRHRLLQTYLNGPQTDEEAGNASGLRKPGCAYWMRCSELRQGGFIQPVGLTRTASTGEQQMVCEITEAGRIVARRLEYAG